MLESALGSVSHVLFMFVLASESTMAKRDQQQNRQVFKPQPGVSIEHTPISRSSLVSRPPSAKKSKTGSVVTTLPLVSS